MKRTLVIATILLLLVVSGCKSTRDTQPVSPTQPTETPQQDPREVLFNNMIDAYGTWESVVVKGSASIGHLNSSFELKMVNGRALQISLRPLLGIEVARLVVQDDKIYIFDKINKQYIEEELTTLIRKLPFEPTISNLQSILLGQPFILGEPSLSAADYKRFDISIAGNDWTMHPKKKIARADYLFAMSGEYTESLQVTQAGREKSVTCHYRDYLHDSRHLYPSTLSVKAQSNDKEYSLNLYYTTMTWDNNPTILPLSTQGYTRTTFAKLIEMLL